MSRQGTKTEYRHLERALIFIRELRSWAFKEGVNPWIVRQALITAISLDTRAALERGVDEKALTEFDNTIAKELYEAL